MERKDIVAMIIMVAIFLASLAVKYTVDGIAGDVAGCICLTGITAYIMWFFISNIK